MSVFLTLDDLENFKKSYLYFQGVKLVGTWRFQQVVILEKNTEFLNVDYYGENVPSLNVHICAFVWDLINHSKSAKVLCSPTPVKQAVVLRIGRALSGGRPRMFQHENPDTSGSEKEASLHSSLPQRKQRSTKFGDWEPFIPPAQFLHVQSTHWYQRNPSSFPKLPLSNISKKLMHVAEEVRVTDTWERMWIRKDRLKGRANEVSGLLRRLKWQL